MPEALVYTDPVAWWAAMADLLPELVDAAYILTPSTSSRVLRDGKPAFAGGGWHAYAQIRDADDLERFGHELLLKAMTTPHGFMRELYRQETGEVIGHRPWSIFDPTTFTPERLVFDGQPMVRGDGLTVAPVKLQAVPGERINTAALVLADSDAEQIAKRTGYKVERVEREGISTFMLVNDRDLRLDTQIETEHGMVTVAEYWRSEHDKLRAQAVFRPDSESWAAYLNRHQDDSPFLFDVGTQTKFMLVAHDHRDFARQEVAKLASDDPDAVERVLRLVGAGKFTTVETDRMLRQVKRQTGIGLTVLRRGLAATFEADDTTTHPELAKLVVERCGDALYAQSTFWRWSYPRRGVWCPVDDRTMRQVAHAVCDEHLGGDYGKSTIDSVLDLVKTELHQEAHPFDSHPDAINLASGELSLVAGQWRHGPHVREHYCTTQLPVRYEPGAMAPRFERFLEEIFAGDVDAPAKRLLVLEAIGYSLLATCRFEAFFLLIGSGANGKSVLLSVIEALLGREHVCAVQPSQFDNRFQRAHLRGKLANIVTEIAEGAQIADAELKAIVSGELTTAEHKLKPPFDFHPVATMWFGTNHMPHTRDFSDALFRRARILTFNNKFEGEACDPRLADKLKPELPGILNMALDAIGGVLTRGAFTDCPSDREARLGWRLEADQVAQFIEDEAEPDQRSAVPSREIFMRYRDWAAEAGIKHTMTRKGFTERLARLGFRPTRTPTMRMIQGLRLKPQTPVLGWVRGRGA